MAYRLNDISLLTHGLVAPLEYDGDEPQEFCLGSFELLSHGIIVTFEEAGAKLADPYRGPSRFNEPFDRGYYLWKYGPQIQARQQDEEIEQQPEPPAIDEEELRRGLRARRIANYEAREIGRLEREVRDGLELKLYIAELEDELEARLANLVKAAEEDRQRRQALIARLEENRAAARDALLLVLERQRKRRNMQLAVEASIRLLY